MPNSTGDIYMDADYYSSPDSVTALARNSAVICANIGPTKILGIGMGGAFGISDPLDVPEEP
jgi:hypothetical protein